MSYPKSLLLLFLLFFTANFLQADPLESVGISGAALEHVDESDLPQGAVFTGQFDDAVRWEDKGGTNYFITAAVQKPREYSSDIYVYQYVVKNGRTSLVWDIKDFGRGLCPATFEENSLQVIDLDKDGIMETSFMYSLACDGLDPTPTKLMMHHKGKKLAIRGTRVHQESNQPEMTPDASFNSVTPIFRNFAEMQWNISMKYEQSYYIFEAENNNGYIIYGLEDLYASGGITYLVTDKNGKRLKLDKTTDEDIAYAEDFEFYPDQNHLLYLTYQKLAILDLKTGQSRALVTFYDDNEAVSDFTWSPDKSKLAFVTLNYKRYDKDTKIFILTLDKNGQVINKQKFDESVKHMAASSWVVENVSFIDNNTIQFELNNTREINSLGIN